METRSILNDYWWTCLDSSINTNVNFIINNYLCLLKIDLIFIKITLAILKYSQVSFLKLRFMIKY
jgi:hypothetical protein